MKINREWKDFEILATGDGEKLGYHFISPSNPVNPENFLILGAKIRRKFETTKFFKEKIILKIPNSLK